ncbi:hypothetical protein [Pseudonocardia sp. N23]|uniref:hypothetical protein n=1 Tax=Pseudonocardia sp. N23 TaxID=1987376 RepID=UPI001145BD98|nr:hypothetical protein [Pseudonocardia sp. N23]
MSRYVGPIRRVNRGRGHSYVDANGAKVPGVTTLLGDGVPKPALMDWGPRVTAEYAVDHWDELGKLTPSARLEKLKKARYADRDAAANKGTRVHTLAEQLVAGKTVAVPDDLAGHVESYVAFLDQWDPQPLLVEFVVMSHRHGYAGTGDLAAYFDPQLLLDCGLAGDDPALQALLQGLADNGELALVILDVKTSRSGIFGETALQLAGYRFADVYVDEDGAEQPMPEFHLALALHIRADGYDLFPMTAGRDQHRELLYVREVGQFVTDHSRSYVGPPLSSPAHTKPRRLEVATDDRAKEGQPA